MDEGVGSSVELQPRGIEVFGLLVDREGNCSNQGNACQRSRNASKEASQPLGLVGMANTRRKALELVCLHARLHRVKWKLSIVSSCHNQVLARTHGREGREDTARRCCNLSPISLEETRCIRPSTRRRLPGELALADSMPLTWCGRHRERIEITAGNGFGNQMPSARGVGWRSKGSPFVSAQGERNKR
jgi:hypothetical protein